MSLVAPGHGVQRRKSGVLLTLLACLGISKLHSQLLADGLLALACGGSAHQG